ncbi:MAG: hypothetical protein JNN15_11450, partial [Blastocatellia bacterium]|nr:hypothetical protein [Blastocatellia bacterium]
RYSELLKVDPKAIEKVDFITNKIVDEANKIFKETFTNELLRGFGSIILALYSFVPEKAKILFDCLLAPIPLSSWETLQATSSVVQCCFNLASIAAGINENDKQESFLRLGNQKAKQIDSWKSSYDLYWACRSLVKIPSPEIMDGLLIMLKSVQKISPPSTNEYIETLAQVTTFYIEGLLSTTSDPESEMMKINNVLKNLQNFLEDSLK